MLKKLSILDMHAAMKNRIEAGTTLKCVDDVAVNEKAPFTHLDVLSILPKNTKTMYIDECTIHVHIVSATASSSIPHYENIQAVQEAFTEEIKLVEPFNVFGDPASGLISNYKNEETGERFAVLAFVFKVSYGFRIKQ